MKWIESVLLIDEAVVAMDIDGLAVVMSWLTNTTGKTTQSAITATNARMKANERCHVVHPKRFAQVELGLEDETNDGFVD